MKRSVLPLAVFLFLLGSALQHSLRDAPQVRAQTSSTVRHMDEPLGSGTGESPLTPQPTLPASNPSASSPPEAPSVWSDTLAPRRSLAFLPHTPVVDPHVRSDLDAIERQVDAMLAHPHREDRLLLAYNEAATQASAAALNEKLGAFVHLHYPAMGNGRMVSLTLGAGTRVRDSLVSLIASGFVDYAEPDFIYYPTENAPAESIDIATALSSDTGGHPDLDEPSDWSLSGTTEVLLDAAPNDYNSSSLYGMEKVGAPAAWDVLPSPQSSDPTVIVAVIDTGIRYTHADLAINMWVNAGETPGNGIDDDGNGYIDDIHGIDAITGSGSPADDHGHGTHCAGTIGAVGNNGVGVVGIAWKVNVKLMALKFMGSSNGGATSDAIECINYAVAKGARILSNSWGGTGSSTSLSNAITFARANDCLFIAAAGNSSMDCDATPHYPAAYTHDNIISVGSSDSADRRSSFSNYGKRSVDIFAPGTAILSTSYAGDSAYATMSGTSMAAPLVAGACAVIKAARSSENYPRLRERLLSTVDFPSGLKNLVATDGRMNLARAVQTRLDLTASDVLWHNPATGQVCVWEMQSGNLESFAVLSQRVLGWQARARVDFDGDGDDDLVWVNPTDGAVCIWYLNGTTLTSSAVLSNKARGWNLIAARDLNADQNVDLLWRHATSNQVCVWYLHGTSLQSYQVLNATVSGWSLITGRDDDSDRNAELFWHNPTTGQLCRWVMSGTNMASYAVFPNTVKTWVLSEVRDFNNDGSVDLFWHHPTTGQVCIWSMNGLALASHITWQTTARGWQLVPTNR